MTVLAAALIQRTEPTRRFLRAALALERVEMGALVAAGVPHWDAADLLGRLVRGGEVREGVWQPEAREVYLLAIAAPVATALERLGEGERPREKALRGGIDCLDDAELIALLMRTGIEDEGVLELAARHLREQGGLAGLARLPVESLAGLHGLGPAKAAELAAAFELGRRLAAATLRERPLLREPEAVVALLAPFAASMAHEELWCLPLDRQSRLIGAPRVVSKGDVDGTDAGPRAFFRAALTAGAVSAIAVHNHPSGDPSPSAADREVTRRLVQAGRTVDVALVDHLVLGLGAYVSLRRDAGELFR